MVALEVVVELNAIAAAIQRPNAMHLRIALSCDSNLRSAIFLASSAASPAPRCKL